MERITLIDTNYSFYRSLSLTHIRHFSDFELYIVSLIERRYRYHVTNWQEMQQPVKLQSPVSFKW